MLTKQKYISLFNFDNFIQPTYQYDCKSVDFYTVPTELNGIILRQCGRTSVRMFVKKCTGDQAAEPTVNMLKCAKANLGMLTKYVCEAIFSQIVYVLNL